MGWSIGWDSSWHRDIGYGVPAFCDHPGCSRAIDRGLAYVCGGEAYGGEKGCGLYFCGKHLSAGSLCEKCANPRVKTLFKPKPDHPRWTRHKLRHRSWAEWRRDHPNDVKKMERSLA